MSLALRMAAAMAAGAASDPYWANVTTLINGSSATITDKSTTNNTLSIVGNTVLSATQVKYNVKSIYFDGSGDYITEPAGTPLTLGTGDFTIEGWVYPTSLAAERIFIDFRPSGTNGIYILLAIQTNGGINMNVNSSNTITGAAGSITINGWHHIALARSGTSTKLFVNGTQVGSTYTDSNNYLCGASRPSIGVNGANTTVGFYLGYMDDFRITKGVARYTANFTAPTAAFPAR